MKTKIETETMWCIYGTCGLYVTSNKMSKKEAKRHHVKETGQSTWQDCKLAGDRVRKVLIQPIQP